MRNPNRIDKILEKISTIWKLVPDWRFNQLVCNLVGRGDPFYMEDDIFEAILDNCLEQIEEAKNNPSEEEKDDE